MVVTTALVSGGILQTPPLEQTPRESGRNWRTFPRNLTLPLGQIDISRIPKHHYTADDLMEFRGSTPPKQILTGSTILTEISEIPISPAQKMKTKEAHLTHQELASVATTVNSPMEMLFTAVDNLAILIDGVWTSCSDYGHGHNGH